MGDNDFQLHICFQNIKRTQNQPTNKQKTQETK